MPKSRFLVFFAICFLFVNFNSLANPKYFGFWGDAMRGAGKGNYIQETHSFSNVHFINGSMDGGAHNEWREKILLAKSLGNKSVLMLEGCLFKWHTAIPSSNRNYLLTLLKQKLVGLEDQIVAVYLIDEPYFKNSLQSNPISEEEVYANLHDAALLVKKFFPNVKIALTEAAPMVEKLSIKFPESISWIGMNCYSFYRECPSASQYKNLIDRLMMNKKPNQELILTLDGFWWNKEAITNLSIQNKIIQRNKEVLDLLKTYPIVGFFPFIYQSLVSTNEELVGSIDLTNVKTYLTEIGQRVKNGTFQFPPVCTVLAPTCEGKDYVRRDSCGKEIERWRNAPAPYCPIVTAPAPAPTPSPTCTILEPKCEGLDYVRRDSCGKEIERWRNAPAPYCPIVTVPAPVPTCTILEPKCEGLDYVRRDSCGKEIERWRNAPPPYCTR